MNRSKSTSKNLNLMKRDAISLTPFWRWAGPVAAQPDHSNLVRSSSELGCTAPEIFESARITSTNHARTALPVETAPAPRIHPRVPRAAHELPAGRCRTANPLRPAQRALDHLFLRQGARASAPSFCPAGVDPDPDCSGHASSHPACTARRCPQ